MHNFKQQPPKAQGSQWLTQNCGRAMPFSEVVAKAATRKHLLPELALEYQARNAKHAERLANVGGKL
ncbi:MAG: hypothetical protein WBH20_14845 [Oceanisphaera sp.]|uniref:hypothetical protein n=1 Tax=Oceanisphaera sp. TaxID=1929979 RepID=UPI003C750199